MAKALNRMRALFPKEFDFYPRTWTLPAQLDTFRAHCEAASERGGRPPTYIVKPSGGSQGTGIYLLRGVDLRRCVHGRDVHQQKCTHRVIMRTSDYVEHAQLDFVDAVPEWVRAVR